MISDKVQAFIKDNPRSPLPPLVEYHPFRTEEDIVYMLYRGGDAKAIMKRLNKVCYDSSKKIEPID